ncbi:MAG: flagellar FlbD family protein [Armatimonadota bacterium]
MITLTRINGEPIVVNADLIQQIESTPDTLLFLTNDRRIMVRESVQEVVEAIINYRRQINQCHWCDRVRNPERGSEEV